MSVKTIMMSAAGAGGPKYWYATVSKDSTTTPSYFVTDGDIVGIFNTDLSDPKQEIIKISKSGAVSFNKGIYANGGTEYMQPGGSISIGSTSTGNVTILGLTNGGTRRDAAILDFNSSLVFSWGVYCNSLGGSVVNISGASISCTPQISSDSSGNVYLASVYEAFKSPSTTAAQLLVSKFSSSGSLLWKKQLGTIPQYSSELNVSIGCDSSDNLYLSGLGYQYYGYAYPSTWFAKVTSTGTLGYGNSGIYSNYSYSSFQAVDSSGNTYRVIRDGVNGTSNIAKYNSSGVWQWEKMQSTIIISGQGVAVSPDNYLYTVGNYGGTNDKVITKYDLNGTIKWRIRLKYKDTTWNPYGNLRFYFGSGGELYFTMLIRYQSSPYTTNPVIFKLNPDGSLIGSYGDYIISSLSNADTNRATATLGSQSGSLSVSNDTSTPYTSWGSANTISSYTSPLTTTFTTM